MFASVYRKLVNRIYVNTLINFAQTGEKDVEVAELWKGRRQKPESPHSAFRRWRKSASLKLSEAKTTNSKIGGKDKNTEEDMSLLKFLAIVSVILFVYYCRRVWVNR